jgi:hypothetical protein
MFDDVAYLRGQALFCLELAQELSDHEAAKRLKQEAMDYTLRAERLEEQAQQAKRDEAVRECFFAQPSAFLSD